MLTIRNTKVRTLLRYAIPFLLVPLLVAVGAVAFEGKRYLIISLL